MGMRPAPVRAIVFDAEGVVLDTEDLWDEAQVAFLGRYGVRYERDVLKPLLSGRSLVEGAALLKERFGLPGEPGELAVERRDVARDLLAERARYMPGFETFFARVRTSYATCIATGLDSELLSLVDKRLALAELFEGRVYSVDLVPRAKPAPDIFLYAARALAVEPEVCVVVEDSPHGIAAARAAGMRCVALTSTYERDLLELEGPDAIADDWRGVEETLTGWAG